MDAARVYAWAAAARPDGSVVLAGQSYGTFDTPLSTANSYSDFAAVAIDEDGRELWRWQVLQFPLATGTFCTVARVGFSPRNAAHARTTGTTQVDALPLRFRVLHDAHLLFRAYARENIRPA